MSFFLSSPPQPTYQKLQPHQDQPSFFTPQSHRTNFFPTSAWPSFQPVSPSPLRPSWNTGNVMRRQSNNKADSGSENIGNAELGEQIKTGELAASCSGDTVLFTSYFTCDTQRNTPSDTQAQTSNQNEISSSRNPFQYQSRARDSAPTAQISTRIKKGRDTRRGLFLDRLRSSRRDERDSRNIDKFEESEYWRERRIRDQQMMREAERIHFDDGDVDEGIMYEYECGQEEMSPVDEETELDVLVEGWYQGSNQVEGHDKGWDIRQEEVDVGGGDAMDTNFDFEDSDIEEAFMQVLSQQGTDTGHGPTSDPSRVGTQDGQEGRDTDMS